MEKMPLEIRTSKQMAAMQTTSMFVVHDSAFSDILGSNPKLNLLLENQDYPFAHEAGVFMEASNELFITSNKFLDPSGKLKVQISKVVLGNGAEPPRCEEICAEDIQMGNGGVNYKDGILFCAQGSSSSPSGLFEMSPSAPYAANLLVSDFYGRPFNSVNDVVVHSDGSIWFTDPIYGFEQGYRPRPALPNQVYRYDPRTRNIRAVADGMGRPNGLCFSPDEKILYITDTDRVHGDGSIDGMRPSTIYAFDVLNYSGQPFLVNKRLFAMADNGIPDGIKCDTNGNVYSGCGDGINAWSPGGVLLGRVLTQGGAANFCFGKGGQLFILNEHRLWRAQLADFVKGAC